MKGLPRMRFLPIAAIALLNLSALQGSAPITATLAVDGGSGGLANPVEHINLVTFNYSDTRGFQDIVYGQFKFQSPDHGYYCTFQWQRINGQISRLDTGLAGNLFITTPRAPGSGSAGTNGKSCNVYLSGSSIVESGNRVSVTLAIAFNEDFEGNYAIQTTAFDMTNTPGPVQSLGTWTALPRVAVPSLSIANAATFTAGPIAPGLIASIFGAAFTTGAPASANVPLPSSLAGLTVLVNGIASPLFYVSAAQVNFQVPKETPPGLARITVKRTGLPDLLLSCDVQLLAPSLLRSGVADYAAARGPDGVTPAPASPADPSAHAVKPGDVLTFYALGLGPTTPAVPAGSSAPLQEPLARLSVPPTVYFGSSYADSKPGTILFAGLAPGSAGLYQINVQVPAGVRTGEHVPVTLTFPGYTSNTVEVAVAALPRNIPDQISWYQDMKFGTILHFGVYSEKGIEASWPLEWSSRSAYNPAISTTQQMQDFRQFYWGLASTFNPVAFNPQAWVSTFQTAGLKYSIFTAKHCDGFSLFDTQLTDYKVTSPAVPFSSNPRADITKQVFQALRDQHLGVGAYLCKPDWHSDDFWRTDVFATTEAYNYDISLDPARFQRFGDFFHGQSLELAKNYGPLDIYWIDGGWIQGLGEEQLSVDMRTYQPGMLFVNRYGAPADYQTYEQTLPGSAVLDTPWEGLQPLGGQWAFNPQEIYLPSRQVIQTLADVTANGGNYLLGLGISADGSISPYQTQRVNEVGAWLRVNGEGIYYTRPVAPYVQGNVSVTAKFNSAFVIYKFGDTEFGPPAQVTVPNWHPSSTASVQMLGSNDHVNWSASGSGIVIQVPASAQAAPPAQHAIVFKFSQ